MASPVMQALQNIRMQEASPFGKWCIVKGVRCLPAAPAHVAAFVRDCEPLIEIEEIWQAVKEISHSHLSNGLADPTVGGVVAETINSIASIDPPRSWPRAHHAAFKMLPLDLQRYMAEHEGNRDKAVRRALNEAGQLRRTVSDLQEYFCLGFLPPTNEENDGITFENTA
jgi:hypothetical protein